jgi:hypothetical protein
VKYAALILTFFLVGAVIASEVQNYLMSQTATVTGVTFYLDGTLYMNNTVFDWLDLECGETCTVALNVSNTLSNSVTVWLSFSTLSPLPSGWTEQWTLNGTSIPPTTNVAGLLSLTVPNDAPLGTFAWDMWVNIA